jgi:hypothetical protein
MLCSLVQWVQKGSMGKSKKNRKNQSNTESRAISNSPSYDRAGLRKKTVVMILV